MSRSDSKELDSSLELDKERSADRPAFIGRLGKYGAAVFVLLSFSFAFMAVFGQVAENVSLALWSSAVTTGNSNCSNSVEGNYTMDPYFVLSFSSFTFFVLFGVLAIISAAVNRADFSKSLRFPQWQFMVFGFLNALNGLLVVYASPDNRTAPFLQAILGNIIIPCTMLFRFIFLRKKPTLLKFICALLVLLGLVLSVIPVIFNMDKDSESDDWKKQSTAGRILWPLCFMIGFVPAALMNVVEEKSMKDSRKVDPFYFLFFSSFYQSITALLLFWTDIIPGFGMTDDIDDFGRNYYFALRCFFGGAGCGYSPGLRGTVFMITYVIAYVGSAYLVRYTEGATFLAIVQALVTPLGALFWSLFTTHPCGGFSWGPHADSLTYFSIAGICVMMPSIYLYNAGEKLFERIKGILSQKFRNVEMFSKNVQDEKTPLLN